MIESYDAPILLIDPTLFGRALGEVSVIIAAIIGFIGIIIMTYGSVRCGTEALMSAIKREDHVPKIRIELGKYLALGLEFLVGKDIIETIVHPTWDDLGKLAAIIALRTILTLFVSWELKHIGEELKEEREIEEMIGEEIL